MASRETGGKETLHRIRIAPADLDVKHFDAGAERGSQTHPILCRGDQPRALALGQPAQPGDLVRPEGMMVGKGPRQHDSRAERAKAGEELFRPADPGERHDASPGVALALAWLQLAME